MGYRRWVVDRASQGRYEPSCFRMEDHVPPPLAEGQVLVETVIGSLDPTHLNWIKLDPVLQFLPVGVGDPMLGANIGRVRESRHPGFAAGQVVTGMWGWEQLAIADPAFLRPALPENEMPFADQLAVLSHVGLAAAGGMMFVGEVKPQDRVLVSAAAGATGSVAAQIAKALGCHVVGLAGGAAKCRYLVEELGLDAAIDYKAEDVASAIPRLFPDGVDLFFDNVGGAILDVVLANMAIGCRIAACGAIAQYDRQDEAGFPGIRNLPLLIFRRARIEGYIAGQFGDERNAQAIERLITLYREGKLKVRTQSVPFDRIPEALTLLLDGRNEGKLIAEFASHPQGNQ